MSTPRNNQHLLALRHAIHAINKFGLSLENVTVLTECATGPYVYTACIAALAGARVFAVAKDSPYGTTGDVIAQALAVAREWDVQERICFSGDDKEEYASEADIITNSGCLRPINKQFIHLVKDTAVIPLMWESFEWRPEELDLDACKNRGILVLGTDEKKIGFINYATESIIKIIHSCDLPIHGSNILVLGSGDFIESIAHYMERLGANTRICSRRNKSCDSLFLDPQSAQFRDVVKASDVIICCEYFDKGLILGDENSLLPIGFLEQCNDNCVIVNKHGSVDEPRLRNSPLQVLPSKRSAPWMHPNFTTAILGERPVIDLMTAGLRVGQAMSEARLRGLSTADAALYAIRTSPAQDFKNKFAWTKPQAHVD